MMPHVIGTLSSPKKESVASIAIASVTPNIMYRKLSGRTFGTMWRKITCQSLPPATRAASM